MSKTTHIHQYQKEVLGKDYKILRCHLPGCKHYISEKLGVGKMSLCNRCGEPLILTTWHLQVNKPHCQDCTRKKLTGIAARHNRVKENNIDRLKELLTADDLLKMIVK